MSLNTLNNLKTFFKTSDNDRDESNSLKHIFTNKSDCAPLAPLLSLPLLGEDNSIINQSTTEYDSDFEDNIYFENSELNSLFDSLDASYQDMILAISNSNSNGIKIKPKVSDMGFKHCYKGSLCYQGSIYDSEEEALRTNLLDFIITPRNIQLKNENYEQLLNNILNDISNDNEIFSPIAPMAPRLSITKEYNNIDYDFEDSINMFVFDNKSYHSESMVDLENDCLKNDSNNNMGDDMVNIIKIKPIVIKDSKEFELLPLKNESIQQRQSIINNKYKSRFLNNSITALIDDTAVEATV